MLLRDSPGWTPGCPRTQSAPPPRFPAWGPGVALGVLRSHLLDGTAGSPSQASCFSEIVKPQPCGSLDVSPLRGSDGGPGSGSSSGPVPQLYGSALWLDLSVQGFYSGCLGLPFGSCDPITLFYDPGAYPLLLSVSQGLCGSHVEAGPQGEEGNERGQTEQPHRSTPSGFAPPQGGSWGSWWSCH